MKESKMEIYSNLLRGDYLKYNELENFALNPDDLEWLQDKKILILGGSSIAFNLLKIILKQVGTTVGCVDSSEEVIYELTDLFDNGNSVSAILGDITDFKFLKSVFKKFEPDICYNFAAYKSVDISKIAPEAFVKVNCVGVKNVLQAAIDCPSLQVFLNTSTLLANSPKNIYATTKFLSEVIITDFAKHNRTPRVASLQLCNVFDTAGQFFLRRLIRQLKERQKITIYVDSNGQPPLRRFASPQAISKILIKLATFCNGGHVFSIPADAVNPISILRIIEMVANVIKVTDWRNFVNLVALPADRSITECFPDGYRSTSFPLKLNATIPPLDMSQVHKILTLSYDVSKRDEIVIMLNEIAKSDNKKAELYNVSA
jgi:nucleoside-diphosphate-sugar epimerase